MMGASMSIVFFGMSALSILCPLIGIGLAFFALKRVNSIDRQLLSLRAQLKDFQEQAARNTSEM